LLLNQIDYDMALALALHYISQVYNRWYMDEGPFWTPTLARSHCILHHDSWVWFQHVICLGVCIPWDRGKGSKSLMSIWLMDGHIFSYSVTDASILVEHIKVTFWKSFIDIGKEHW